MQIPTPAPGELERWLIPAAAVLYIVALVKKVFWPKPPAEGQYVTNAEHHRDQGALSDKIDARFLMLSEKIEALGTSIHTRLNQLEAGLARVDERTKK